MGIEQPFNRVKLFCGFIYHDAGLYDEVRRRMESIYSPVDTESPVFDFDKTDYYDREMGTPLYKRFIAFEELIDPMRLPEIKLLTNDIEIEMAVEGNRRINLDPGYLSDANVILATTKNHYHRVPLSKGIYAHIEYVLKRKKPVPMEWTYPDFQTAQYMEFFEKLYQLYRMQIKKKNVATD